MGRRDDFVPSREGANFYRGRDDVSTMDAVATQALKLLILLTVAGVLLTAGLWVYLALGLVLGVAGPVFSCVLLLYVVNDVYTTVAGG